MRVTSYFVTFVAVAFTSLLNFLSSSRPDWLVVKYKEVLYTTVTVFYGLTQRCQLQITQTDDGKLSYRNYECRKFPTPETEYCDKDEYKYICTAWSSAYYLDQIALGIGAVALVTVLFGVTSHSRRRRIWKTVAGLLFLTASCQVSVFVLVTDLYNKSAFPSFDRSRPGLGYILHTLSWVLNVIIVLAVIGTGISSDSGHQWAAGNDAYAPIA